MNWYSFLIHEQSFFNANVSCLIALKTLKAKIATVQDLICKNNNFAMTFSSIKLNLFPKNGH